MTPGRSAARNKRLVGTLLIFASGVVVIAPIFVKLPAGIDARYLVVPFVAFLTAGMRFWGVIKEPTIVRLCQMLVEVASMRLSAQQAKETKASVKEPKQYKLKLVKDTGNSPDRADRNNH